MRKIALRGLIGRKRDTLLLWSVVALAFLFLVLSTTLIASLQATDAAQRVNAYGQWQVMAGGLPAQAGQELARKAETSAVLPMIPVSGTDYFAGDNSYYLSIYSPELEQLGRFQLKEGRWPQARNEIVLENARMASIGLEVGDTFTVSCQRELTLTKEAALREAVRLEEVQTQAQADIRERCLTLLRSGEWQAYADQGWYSLPVEGQVFAYWTEYYQQGTLDDAWSNLFGFSGKPVSIGEMTEEQFCAWMDWYLSMDHIKERFDLTPYWTEEERAAQNRTDLLGKDELMVRTGQSYSGEFTLNLLYEYTVCGVLETYTDRWDSGSADLPAGFVTEENYQLLLDGRQLVLEKYPRYTTQEFDTLVLLSNGADSSARTLWQELLPAYNQAMLEQEDFTYPQWTVRATVLGRDDAGWVTGTENEKGQINFTFLMADPDMPRWEEAETVNAWLVMAEWPYREGITYCSDHFLNDEDGEDYGNWCRGSLNDLVEIGEDKFQLVSYYDYGVFKNTFYGDLDSSYVAFDLGGERHEVPLEDFRAGNFTVNGMVPLATLRTVWAESLDQPNDFDALRLNRLAYPSSAESGESLLLLVTGILFVTTVCAVFQIFFTQVRRRLRRIVLLKSLGAETGQIAGMLGWEFLYFWLTAMPAGVLLGLGGAWAACAALGGAQGREVLLTVEPATLGLALLAGTLALLLGMCVPMAMAVGVPLTGRTVRKKALPPPKKETRQDFLHVTLRGLQAKRGRTAGSFALCAFMMTIGVLCLFLGFQMTREYRETVVRDGKPDYLLRSPYAMSQRQREEYLAGLEELGVCGGIESYFVGEDIELDRAAWEGSPLVGVAAGDTEELQAAAYPVDLYTIYAADPLFEKYRDAATVGSLTPESFEAHWDGARWDWDVLVMVPLYRDAGRVNEEALSTAQGWDRLAASGIETSYYPEMDGPYRRDTALQVGDELVLRTETDSLSGDSYVTSNHEVTVTVGAILYYFPDTGIWPVSGSREGYQIVADPSLLPYLLPSTCRTQSLDTVRGLYVAKNGFQRIDNEYGLTDFYITVREGVDLETADTALLVFARNHYMEIEVYHESSEKLLRDAVNNILLVCLLCLTAMLLALVIFSNTVTSDIEQERRRIGILQSMGVSNRQLILRQVYLGLASSALAVAAANLLLWAGAAVYAAAGGKVLANLLWGYPVGWHILLCLVLAGVLTLLYALPMLRLRSYLPIDNIRTRK